MKNSQGKVKNFIKKNAIYFVLGLCVVAIGFSIVLALTNKEEENLIQSNIINAVNENDVSAVDTTPVEEIVEKEIKPTVKEITYILPVNNYTRIEDYSSTVVFNSTLKRYSSHQAVDFFAPEGTPVLAVTDGTIESVETTILTGTTIVINHGNGVKSIYNSLLDGDSVSVGQKVSQGNVIGEVSVSNRQESKEGAHLHFSMMKDNQVVDPSNYLTFLEK
ncbi:MAG: M23 family metallopeptidase [Clostridia bacterium]|nr:M23 family metallopeptidase [Clostridia bacterium]